MSGDRVAIVAGSGIDLRPLLEEVVEERPFGSFAGLGAATVGGHEGVFLTGRSGGVPVVVQCGRLHVYEGRTPGEAAATVDVLAALGARAVVFTNAAGGLLPEAEAGALVGADAVWCWPWRGGGLPDVLTPTGVLDGCDAAGAYVWMHGPCYETRAEVGLLAGWGAATVGMSTAPELVRCAALGLETAVVSCVTNHCLKPQVLSHDHVVRTAQETSRRLRALLAANLPSLAVS